EMRSHHPSPIKEISMTEQVHTLRRRNIGIGAVLAAILAAALVWSVGTADAGGNKGGAMAPAPKDAVVTTQGKFDARQRRPDSSTTKGFYDKRCQRSGHRPLSCFPHSH